MSRLRSVFRGLGPQLLVLLGLLSLGMIVTIEPAFAQSMISDQTSTAQATIAAAPTTAVLVSAVTIDKATGGIVISPPAGTAPGFAVANARIHLKHVKCAASAAGPIAVYEHPSTGANKLICFVFPGANNAPDEVKAGNNEVLGLQGYLTATGSSIVFTTTSNASETVYATATYSLE